MNLATVQFHSEALQRHVTYSVILPEKQEGPAPVLLQLHGYSDAPPAWLNLSNLARYARNYPFIIVLPDGATSFYINMHPLARYEDFIMQDLWQHVSNTFQVRQGPWAVGGLSMGGFGAIHLAATYPDRFASVWAHSGWYAEKDEMRPEMVDVEDLYIYPQVAALAASKVKPVITFDCGTEDSLLPQNRRLHQFMDSLGLAHRYFEYPGAHTWDYWDLHVQKALRQHAEVLG